MSLQHDQVAFARSLSGAVATKTSVAAEPTWAAYFASSANVFAFCDLVVAGYGYYTRIGKRKPRDVLSAIIEYARYFTGS